MSSGSAAYLIVNADDFGLTPGVNEAIVEAHRRGIVTSTSLLAGGTAFEDALNRLRQAPQLGVGVHLCLDEERPVLDPAAIPTLVGQDGRLRRRTELLRRLFLGRIRLSDVEREYGAQLRKIVDAGIRPTHVDSHGQLHAHPLLGRIARRAAAKFGIRRIRRSGLGGTVDLQGGSPGRVALVCAIALCDALSRRMNTASGFVSPDRQLGAVRSGSIDPSWVVRAIGSLRPGTTTELVLHPGLASDDEARRRYGHWGYRWQTELEAATAPAVLEALREREVRLVSFAHLQP